MYYISAFGAILVILVIWIISVQRSLVVINEKINNAMLQIGVQMSSQWKALTFLLDLTRGYAFQECKTITETVKARRSITKNSSHEDVIKQEKIIAEAVEAIMLIAESYPDLKADTTYLKTMEAVQQYQNMMQTSGLIYNDSARKLNHAIRMFPTCMIAGILGFSKIPCFEEWDGNDL